MIPRRAVLAAGVAAIAVPVLAQTPSGDIVKTLVPSGRLRAAINVGNTVLAQKDPVTGVVSGASVDIARELGRRLGVPVDLVLYDAAGKVVTGLDADRWDVAFMGADPARAAQIVFTAPYVFIDGTYLVREGSPYRSVDDLDRPGARITVGQGAAYDLALTRQLKNATLVREPTSIDAIARFRRDNLEAAAGVRQSLVDAQKATPGYRVIPDSYVRIEQTVAIPKGRDAGFAFVAALVEELKASGFVRASLDRSGQTGATVAPPAKP